MLGWVVFSEHGWVRLCCTIFLKHDRIFRSGQIRLDWIRLDWIRLDWIRLGWVRLSQVQSGHIRSGWVVFPKHDLIHRLD